MDLMLVDIVYKNNIALKKISKFFQATDDYIPILDVLRKCATISTNKHFRFLGGSLFYSWFFLNAKRHHIKEFAQFVRV